MASLHLWLLRHGATEWAINGRHTGSTDLPLLPQGETEARALAPILAKQTFAAVLSSPLQRARRTCELAGLSHQAQIEPDLKEWDYGDYEGLTTPEIRVHVPGWTVFSHPCPGGESSDQVQQRCERVIERASQYASSAQAESCNVALFAHGHILRSLAGCWLGQGPAGGAQLVLGTGSFCVLGYERQKRALIHWNAPVLLA
ncbi:histidine phosphatase family protein [Synechococcus sp. A10-1-5-1]|uniref:histidine phosphatase family protein n=1 Tax=Synechococcus sp. A10-1-5-1 TaxID=2936507 RepID=UPI002000AB50|nr:histidine phosphatase family protein [Synechococcus sp. A10-1-5-1]UPM50997.1 histidine phosphatase family protein [Synechococcus sp. A10-1-5-1]